MLKAIKIRLYPEYEQQLEMNKMLGSCRFVYNHCLALKISAYTEDKTSLSMADLNKKIILLKNTSECAWLKDAHSKVVQQSIINLMTAYERFFKKIADFPTFKKKHGNASCRFPVDAISGVIGNRFNLTTKLTDILFKCSTKDEKYLNKNKANIKSATLSKTKSGKYFLSVLLDKFIPKTPIPADGIIGIDLGIKDFVVCSDGKTFANLKLTRTNEKKLAQLHRRLSKKQKGSKNKNKARLALAKFEEKLTNKKQNYLHQVANALLSENQVIAMENLNVSGMMKNHNLARSIQELSLGEFKGILSYKSIMQNKTVVQINMFYPSSKLCNKCGYKNKSLTLKDREWTCQVCGEIHERDHNAAINVEKEGFKIYNEQQILKDLGLSKPEKSVENSNVDDPTSNGSLKSTYSMKQKDKVVKLVNEIYVK